MTGERQPVSDPPPQWLLEVVDLVERGFNGDSAAPPAVGPTAGAEQTSAPKLGFWDRFQRIWEALAWHPWDSHG